MIRRFSNFSKQISTGCQTIAINSPTSDLQLFSESESFAFCSKQQIRRKVCFFEKSGVYLNHSISIDELILYFYTNQKYTMVNFTF